MSVVSQQLIVRRGGKGRCAAIEVMHINPAIRKLIREAKPFQIPTGMQTIKKTGMLTMDEALCDLYARNLITSDDAIRYAQDVAFVTKRLSLNCPFSFYPDNNPNGRR